MFCCIGTSTPSANKPIQPADYRTSNHGGDLVAVKVPPGMRPGKLLTVRHPKNGRVVSASIPQGHAEGQTFHVQFPKEASVVVSVATVGGPQPFNNTQPNERPQPQQQPQVQINGHPQQQQKGPQGKKKYKRCSQEMLLLHNKGLVKITVPPNLQAGDRMRVQIPDGRTIDVVIPPGNGLSEFHVKVPPKKQNFHSNPVAIAPMFLGPMLL